MSRFYEIEAVEKGTVEMVLRRQGGFTRKQISRAKFIENGIKRNGVRCRISDQAVPGDRIEICLESNREKSNHLQENSLKPEIIYEDQDILLVNKAAGVVTHPRGVHYGDTLANGVAAYFRQKGEEHSVRPVGRLDQDTSGLVVFGKNQVAAARLQNQREKGSFGKIYLALVCGEMEVDGKVHRVELPLSSDSQNRLKMQVDPGGKYACTDYQVLDSRDKMSLVKLTLRTGRTHQIRVHMSAKGHPLVGDRLYGNPEEKISRAALHAWSVYMDHPFTGERCKWTAPVPEDMRKIFPFEKSHEEQKCFIC